MKLVVAFVALLPAAAVVVACSDKTQADVSIKADKPGEVKLNGQDAKQVDVHVDKNGATVNGTPAGTVGVNIGAGGVNVTAPGVNVGVGANGVNVAAPGVNVAVNGGDAGAQAEQIFSQRCSVCHGMSGKGDGPGAAALNPKPRNYTDAAWQASVTDDQIAKTIVEGGQAVGKSPLMAPNADLKDKPDVVKALVAKVRSFKGK